MTREASALEFRVVRVEACGSTNDEAKKLARKGAAEGTAVAAAEQTAGRGTKGRSWHSARGLGLYASVILRPRSASRLSLLPLAAGLAAREAVEKTTGLVPGLRWPNDIILEGKKLGGILCETEFSGNRVAFAVVGLGLNLGHRRADFPPDLRDTAVSVRSAGGRIREGFAAALLGAYLDELGGWFGDLRDGRPARLVRAFEFHSVLKPGDVVEVDFEAGRRQGRYLGLALDGTIRVALAEGERRLASADIVRLIS
jgi:BirA family biotin operon repressor/biotin-[acetyl-CoA-carboxylase] ligase